MHFLVRHIWDEHEPTYHCAVYERSDTGFHICEFGVGGSPTGSLDCCGDHVQPTVLIDDVELIDVPQSLGPIDSVVWLHPLDQCQSSWVDAGKLVWAYGGPRSRVVEDWKTRAILRNEALAVHEAVGRMVERGAEGVKALSNQAGPLFKRGRLDDLGAPEKRMALAIRVVLKEHSVRVATEKGGMFRAQLTEVFFSALKLHPRATERIRHGGDHA